MSGVARVRTTQIVECSTTRPPCRSSCKLDGVDVVPAVENAVEHDGERLRVVALYCPNLEGTLWRLLADGGQAPELRIVRDALDETWPPILY
jgi:hypothetical protein